MPSTTRVVLFALGLVASALAASCGDADLIREARPTSLAGTAWRVVTVNGRPAIPGGEPTAMFGATEVTGFASCNQYRARYALDGATGAIRFEDFAATAMACAEQARNDFETLFTGAIAKVSAASIDPQGHLVLSGAGGEIVLAVDAVSS
jgi:heat shock protein HslJ